MKLSRLLIGVLALLLIVGVVGAQAQQFKIAINFNNTADLTPTPGTININAYIGINAGSTTPLIQESSIFADLGAAFGAIGEYQEVEPPPPSPNDLRFIDVVSSAGAIPNGLLGSVGNYHGYASSAQADTFVIAFARETAQRAQDVVISWPANFGDYFTAGALYNADDTGTPTGAALANMVTTSSFTWTATSATRYYAIITTGPKTPPTPGPTFDANLSPFGTVGTGVTNRNLVVTNNGSANALTISGITISGPQAASFSVLPAPPQTIAAAGGSQTYVVSLNAPTAGTYTASIDFAHTALLPGGETSTSVPVTATVVAGPLNADKLFFTSTRDSVYDNTDDTPEKPSYVEHVVFGGAGLGKKITALNFTVLSESLVYIRNIKKGALIDNSDWTLQSQIYRTTPTPERGSRDSAIIVIYANNLTAQLPGAEGNLVDFEYDVVNISTPEDSTHLEIKEVFSGLENGNSAGVTADPAKQTLVIFNRTLAGDINLDDRVDVLDVLEIVRHILEIQLLTGTAFDRADIAPWPAGDGLVNAQDLALLRNIVLTQHYPDDSGVPGAGDPIQKPIAGGSDKAKASLAKGETTVDAKVTVYLNSTGIAVRLENNVPVLGMQIHFENVPSASPAKSFSTPLGEGYANMNGSQMVALMYDGEYTALPNGNYLVADFPMELADPNAIEISYLVIAGADNKKLANIEIIRTNEIAPELPVDYSLSQNFPNPFNPTTEVSFSVPANGIVKIVVYNMLGQEVRTLVNSEYARGVHVVRWDGRDNNGISMSSGSYIYRMTSGSFVETKKAMLLK